MTELSTIAGLAFLLGMRHATDADHVIAVSTVLGRSRRFLDGTVIGAIWGIGHTITVLVVGLLIIGFNVVIPAPVGLAMEFAVAVMLILLGVLNLTGTMTRFTERLTPPAPLHGHEHAHRHTPTGVMDEHGPRHTHLHGHGRDPGLLATLGWYHLARPLFVGIVHGLAGSAAIALLVLATIADTGTALLYLVVFCAGVAAGMATLTTVIGLPFFVTRMRSARLNRWLAVATGLLSLAFGLYLAYQIGIVDGLFTGDYRWEPG